MMGSLEHGTFDTKLHEAVRYSDVDAVRGALQQGYDPNLIGLYQWSALHEASHNGEVDILKQLLNHKGDPDKPDFLNGFTACHYAAQGGHTDCLSLLLASGGHWDILSKQGQTTLDVAAEECQEILNAAKSRSRQTTEVKTQPTHAQEGTSNDVVSPVKDVTSLSNGMESSKDDVSVSGESMAESITQDCGTDKEPKHKEPVLGYLHLTFEYHAKKTTLKIRVWQVTDLLLPPPTTSMIHSIYVKSYLMPDRKRNSKRKTEDIRVDSSEAHIQTRKGSQGYQHVYTPTTFKFTKPLEYMDVTRDTIREKSVQIEVCITQKLSKRSFLIGQYYMPLKVAVRKLVRESYPLIPCMNHTIPTNMKVYFASDLHITNSAQVFYSNPNIRNLSHSDVSDGSERAVSELDLTGVIIPDDPLSLSDHSVVKVKDFDGEDPPRTTLKRVTILLNDEWNPDTHNIRMSSMQARKVDRSSGTGSEVNDAKGASSVVNHLSAFSCVDKYGQTASQEPDNTNTVVEIPDDSRSSQDKKDHRRKPKEKDKQTENLPFASRPETPTWDYYDFDTGTSVVEIPFEDPPPNVDRPSVHKPTTRKAVMPVCLPMATTLGLQAEQSSRRQKGQRKDTSTVPNTTISMTMVPTVTIPTIVITPDKTRKKSAIQTTTRAQLTIPKKFQANVTPRDVEIDMESFNVESHTNVLRSIKNEFSRTKRGVEVVADVHADGVRRVNSDTSIEIESEDSFVIDLEETPDDNEEFYVGVDNSLMQSKLFKQHPVPMQVFIDESYDSVDESSFVSVTNETKYSVGSIGPVTKDTKYGVGSIGPVTKDTKYGIGSIGPVTKDTKYGVGSIGPVTKDTKYGVGSIGPVTKDTKYGVGSIGPVTKNTKYGIGSIGPVTKDTKYGVGSIGPITKDTKYGIGSIGPVTKDTKYGVGSIGPVTKDTKYGVGSIAKKTKYGASSNTKETETKNMRMLGRRQPADPEVSTDDDIEVIEV